MKLIGTVAPLVNGNGNITMSVEFQDGDGETLAEDELEFTVNEWSNILASYGNSRDIDTFFIQNEEGSIF